MTKIIATDEVVFAAADALMAEGIQPTTLLLRERTKGGYNTVGKALKRWEKARSALLQQEPPPAEVAQKGDLFVRALWSAAQQRADQVLEEVRDAARLKAQAAESELFQAFDHIQQLELEVSNHQKLAADNIASIARERELAQAQAVRLERVEADFDRCNRALEQARAECQQHLVRASSLEGECAALKKQLSQLLQAVRRPSAAKRPHSPT